MNIRFALKALAAAALLASAAPINAAETVVWWDFLGGGDGIRMKKLIEDFNAEHAGAITIEPSTLDWGVPFYTKVQTSAAIGEGPDMMTYHASRIPLAVSQGILAEITPEDYAAMGLTTADFATATWDAVTLDGKQYAVPFDTHPIVLYYNKDKLEAAGLIGADGLPTGLDGIDGFKAAMKKLQEGGTTWGTSAFTAAGDFQFRTIYSLFGQQDGQMMTDGEFLVGDNEAKMVNALKVVQDWVGEGYMPPYTDYPAAIALFTSGESAMHINGVWEVPTMTDLAAKGELFNWGAIELPVFFDHASTYADSHAFAIPANAGKEVSPEKHAAVLEVVSWMAKNSLYWATAGHIPAYGPVTKTPEYAAMQPNAAYSPVTANMIFDPKSDKAGVAGPMYEVVSNYFTPSLNNEMDVTEAIAGMKTDLNDL